MSKDVQAAAPAEEKVLATFQNLEDQGSPLTYSWKGELYTYEDGQAYLMSREQIQHLNSLAITTYVQEMDEQGQLRSKPGPRRRRFSVMEVTREEARRLKAELDNQGRAATS